MDSYTDTPEPAQLLPKLLFAQKEAAKLLSIGIRTMRDLTDDGRITFIRVGKRGIRYSIDDLREYITANRQRRNAQQNGE